MTLLPTIVPSEPEPGVRPAFSSLLPWTERWRAGLREMQPAVSGEAVARRRFLVVEDEPRLAEELAGSLTRMGGDVVGIVSSGQEAVRLAQKFEPDLVLMDIVLPGDMDGVEAARRIREQADLPVVFLSAHTEPRVLERAKQARPLGFLVKPFDEAGLRSTLEIALHQAALERALRDHREWFSTILTSMADGVLVAEASGVLAFMNPAAEALTGWQAERVARQPVAYVCPFYDARSGQLLTHPALMALEGQHVALTEAFLRRADGTLVAAEVSARPVEAPTGAVTGAVVLVRDVTAGRQAAEQLRLHQQQLEAVVAARTRSLEEANRRLQEEIEERIRAEASLSTRSRVEALISDISSTFLAQPPGLNAEAWTEALEKIGAAAGADAAALYILNEVEADARLTCAYEWTSPGVACAPAGPLPGLQASEPTEQLAERLALARGRAKVFLRPLVERDRVLGYLSLESLTATPWLPETRDLLEMAAGTFAQALRGARAEREKSRLQEHVARAQRMEAVGRLSGGIAHDFNNTLLPIIGYADLLLSRLLEDAECRQELLEIRRAAQHAATLTRQLLAFSKKQVVNKVRLDVNTELASMHNLLQRLIEEPVRLVVTPVAQPSFILADSGQFQQVVMNLLANARDAMPHGGTITIETEAIPADSGVPLLNGHLARGPLVRLTVKDTGVGIAPELRDRIFEPFFTTKGSDGTGLGLSVVYSIVEQHGGGLEVESTTGQGSAFHVYWSAAVEAEPARKPVLTNQEGVPRGQGQRVLLVEDEAAVNRFVTAALRQHGYVVLAAETVQQAMALFEREEGCFDMIFSDAILPDGNGVELIDRVLAVKPGLPALLSSGYTDKDGLLRLAAERDIAFLQKPYTLPELLRTVDSVLQGTHCAVLN